MTAYTLISEIHHKDAPPPPNPPLTPPRRGGVKGGLGGKREGRRRTGVEGESFWSRKRNGVLSRYYPDMI
ncbi:MAG: hypothetical protein F6K15_36905 [Okeania sp. SIO2B3]|nr:hypothetical protein [Okeania sp. SIO2B3]